MPLRWLALAAEAIGEKLADYSPHYESGKRKTVISLSHLARDIPPFHVMALLERAQALEAQGRDVIHLEVGEPDFPTSQVIVDAVSQALSRGDMGYTPAAGLPELRETIAEDYRQRFHADVSASQVVVTPGASGALQLALAALVNPGDGVLVCDPGYPCNRQFVRQLGGVPQPVALHAERQFQLDAAQLAAAWQPSTRVAMVASPDNPTGNVLTAAELALMAKHAKQRDGMLLVDEIYQGLTHDHAPESVLSRSHDVIVINSFSKYFCMTGWRLGWLVAPEALVPAIERLAQNLFLAPSTPAQYGALAAFSEPAQAEHRARQQEMKARRDVLLRGLQALGLPLAARSQGAFYVYVDVSAHTQNSHQFCLDLLDAEAVAITPGIDFGDVHGGQRYVRMAYTCDVPRLKEALHRLKRFLENQE